MLIKHLGVAFIYEEEPVQTIETAPADTTVSPMDLEALANQSSEWMDELRQATLRADVYRIMYLIDQIREPYPDLAAVLTEFTEQYDYQKILNFIQEAGG